MKLPSSASITSDSDASGRFGFSTGALERGDFHTAVGWMVSQGVRSIELSALRYDELEPLVYSLDRLPLDKFDYVSFHAPSSFNEQQETRVLELLGQVYRRQWNIIVHPDVIYTPGRWACLGTRLLIENMDRRKPIGRTAAELATLFEWLPHARLCLDVAHARQQDTTMTLLGEIVGRFSERIAEIHISELDSYCQHRPMSAYAVCDYQRFAGALSHCRHVIIESMLDADRKDLRMEEWWLAQGAMSLHHNVCMRPDASGWTGI